MGVFLTIVEFALVGVFLCKCGWNMWVFLVPFNPRFNSSGKYHGSSSISLEPLEPLLIPFIVLAAAFRSGSSWTANWVAVLLFCLATLLLSYSPAPWLLYMQRKASKTEEDES